jgi:hypothetical protein
VKGGRELFLAAQLPAQAVKHAANVIEQDENTFHAFRVSKTELDTQDDLGLKLGGGTLGV